MPNPPAGPNPNRRPVTVEDLIRRAAAAPGRRSRSKALAALAHRAARTGSAAAVYHQLVAAGPTGAKLALEFFARLPGKPPPELADTVLLLLKQKVGPAPIRVSAAGRLLTIVPDTPDGIRPVLTALTAGQSRSAALERLIRLQGRVRRCQTLDRIVAASEAGLPLKCPKCPAKLTRSALIRHLWEKHKLVWEKGKVRTPQALLERAMNLRPKPGAAEPDPDRVDAAFGKTALYFPDVPPSQVFQALAARGSAHPTQLEPLLDRAAGDRCGLCPVCLSALPDPVPELPPPAPVGGGRLAAEGYAVDVNDSPFGRTVAVTTRAGTTDAGRQTAPRTLAVMVAGPILLAATAAAGLLAPRLALPVGGAFAAAGWLAYFAVRFTRSPLPDPADEAVDRAWTEVFPGIGRKLPAVRFLTRLCRTSIGAGTPVDRTPAVWELVEQAAVLADRGGVHLHLLAAARVLQVCDGAEAGRERVAGLLKVFEPFVRGELPLAYAEAAAEILLAAVLPDGEAGRLAVLLVGAAFESGYLPSDLAAIARFSPWVRRLLRNPTDPHLRTLYAVWRGRHQRRWAEVGPAETVFELAERSPAAAKKILASFPDALLNVEADDAVERDLGPVLVCTGGVVAGGATVADPDAGVQLSANGRELQFGSHRIGLDRKLPTRAALSLRGWLKYRGRVLLPSADQPEPRPSGPPRAVAVLAPLAVTCPLCTAVSVVRTGQLGVRWEELTAGRG